jgi:hypothetical protein
VVLLKQEAGAGSLNCATGVNIRNLLLLDRHRRYRPVRLRLPRGNGVRQPNFAGRSQQEA